MAPSSNLVAWSTTTSGWICRSQKERRATGARTESAVSERIHRRHATDPRLCRRYGLGDRDRKDDCNARDHARLAKPYAEACTPVPVSIHSMSETPSTLVIIAMSLPTYDSSSLRLRHSANLVPTPTTGCGHGTPMTSRYFVPTPTLRISLPTSLDNQPYTPRYVAKVSTKGVQDKDFAMTIGYPGSTDRYLSSWGVVNRIENENTPRIVRGIKQEIWQKFMQTDQATRIQYASKYARSSNYWKNSIGMNRGLRRLNVVGTKQNLKKEFADWVAQDASRQAKSMAMFCKT